MTGKLPDQRNPHDAKVVPLRAVASALSNASTAITQKRPPDLDLGALRNLIDVALVDLTAARQADIVRSLAVRASVAAGDLGRLYSGETLDAVTLFFSLQSLRAGLDLVERMLADDRRPGA